MAKSSATLLLRLGQTGSVDSAHIIRLSWKSTVSAESVVVNPRTLELLVGLIHS